MELKNEKLNCQNIDNILSKFSKIKNTVMNLKKVNKFSEKKVTHLKIKI